MWAKVKNVFSIIGAVLSVVLFTVVAFLLGSCSNRRRSNTDDGGTDSIGERIDGCSDGVARAESHIARAKEILRGAISRSREGQTESENCDNIN